MPTVKPILNIDEVQVGDRPQAFQAHGAALDRFSSRSGMIGGRIGAQKLGYNITAVPPGKRAFPLHNHHANEEMFFILQGSGELRVGDERHTLRVGDFIASPAGGPESAHQIINTGSEELRYLDVSTLIVPETVEYPDSGKIALMSWQTAPDGTVRMVRHVSRADASVDYWDGE